MIATSLAKHRLTRGIDRVAAAYLARGFSRKNARRVVIVHAPTRISYSQLYPFLHYQEQLFRRYSVEIRCLPVADVLAGRVGVLAGADIVLLQPWFRITPEELAQLEGIIDTHAPAAEISFLDSFAHNDLRLAPHLPETLRFYVKKSLLKDTAPYMRAHRGDTALTEYYIDLYGLEGETPTDFGVNADILPKLRLGPNFFTAPHLMPGFTAPAPPPQAGRSLDVQTRLGVKGAPWYAEMRGRSQALLEGMDGISLSPKDRISMPRYMEEMHNSRLCFSPFGYGELCWRDIEAMQAGAVLIKQDMGHLETLPDLYEAGVTYLPVKWDFSDLEEVVRGALDDAALRAEITHAAYTRVASYLKTAQFVDDMGFLFTEPA